jgi:hypothetical protein
LFLVLCFASTACSNDHLANAPAIPPQSGCVSDEDCDMQGGELCQFGECVNIACRGAQAPLILVEPVAVDFGEVSAAAEDAPVQLPLEIKNGGQCVLLVQGISLSRDTTPGFGCSLCEANHFPQRVAPGSSLLVQVQYKALQTGEAKGSLLLVSDDETAGTLTVPLSAHYDGAPLLAVDPTTLNFGYVPYAVGQSNRSQPQKVRVMNQGSGIAPLEVSYVFIENGPFQITDPSIAQISLTSPRKLGRYNANDVTTYFEVPVVFTPQAFVESSGRLIVAAHAGTTQYQVEVKLVGSAVGPPKIVVVPESIVFKRADGTPLEVGDNQCKNLDISNAGQSTLLVNQLQLVDPTHDFSVGTATVPPLAPNEHTQVAVCYTPSGPSDPAHPEIPEHSQDALLNVLSNDPIRAAVPVVLSGWAQQKISDDILKLEMTFDRSGNSWAGSDFRDVDIELESPLGFSCTKPVRHYAPDGHGGYTVTSIDDYCAHWTASHEAGVANWIAVGAYEQPERIVVRGLGPSDGAGEYIVRVHYMEDCSNMPTGALAGVLGISTELLFGILGGATGVFLPIDPSSVSNVIAQSCFTHSSTVATVKITINGVETAMPQARLGRKGSSAEVVHLLRRNGRFAVEAR